MIENLSNIIIDGSQKKPITIDVTLNVNQKAKQVVIFCHGFKGFKDWGPFNKIATHFAEKDIIFVKFNFSHNGTSPADQINFVDLKSFGNNNYCKELDDLSLVLDWVRNCRELKKEVDISKVSLFGHSRGGSIAMLKTSEDSRLHKIISWASPSNLLDRLPKEEKLFKWIEFGVAYVYNGRTKQNMPLYYQFYENCIEFANRLNIKNAVSNMRIPHLVVHGSEDSTVFISEAMNIKVWNNNTNIHVISKSNHVLGGFHPYDLEKFPKDLQKAIDITIKFLKH